MTLDELKKIESDAKTLGYRVSELKKAQSILQDLRTGPHATIDSVFNALNRWEYGSDKTAKAEFFAVLTEQMSAAMRIAELRLEAKTRAASEEEKLLRAQISAFFGETKTVAEVSA